MAYITWNESYAVNIGVVDLQHRKLIDLLNQLAEAVGIGRGKDVLGPVLTELLEYTVYHFSTEERLFHEYAYPETEHHRKEHADLTARVRDLQEEFARGNNLVTMDVMQFLISWLNNHILVEDKKFGSFLIDRGVR